MVQQGRTGGRTQHSGLHAVLVRPSELRWQEPGADGDADAALLGVAAVPVLEGSRVRLREMGGKDPGLVCGAPRTFDGQRFAQGMNDLRRTRKAAAVFRSKPTTVTATRQNDLFVWTSARQRLGHRIVVRYKALIIQKSAHT